MFRFFYLIGALIAFYLSFSCSSNWRRSMLTKIVWAVLCAFQSWGYVFYWIFWGMWFMCTDSAIESLIQRRQMKPV